MKYILSLFLIVCIYACNKSDKETYTVSGRFVDGTNPNNKFANLLLHFEDTYHYKEIVKLGETYTDSNGYFKFSYEYGTPFRTNFMRILTDSNFIAKNKLQGLEVSSNWNKTFYLGDSAIFDLYINYSLGNYDTLYFNTWDSLYLFIGPCPNGFSKRYKSLNFNQLGYVSYGIGYNNYYHNTKNTSYTPTGEPIIDKIILF